MDRSLFEGPRLSLDGLINNEGAQALLYFLKERENRPEESGRTFLEVFSDRLKREDPPISIDLTFHILRQMIEIAKNQNQKQQAEQNRIIFDSVGK
ncbi:unnamed protein product [Staurois parvus]|uniref:Corticotropin-releasing factor domain-containing protein n=1 Tax=Staurois parvus TaxID=386267 RepID=A0ABN9DIN3_9NEOB|nr:unnamed protein product [Staurois parvus]